MSYDIPRRIHYSRLSQTSRVLAFLEFWTFVVLREERVLSWSWWWLVAFQVSAYLGIAINDHKAEKS